jgi:hypothetical protein
VVPSLRDVQYGAHWIVESMVISSIEYSHREIDDTVAASNHG